MNVQDSVAPDGSTAKGLSSPLSFAGLLRLLLRPREFFADVASLNRKPEVVFVALIMGVAGSMGQIDKKIIQAELGHGTKGWEHLSPWLLASWANYWLVVLIAGTVGAGLLWLLGGWWYKKRLLWCGAIEVSSRAARVAYAYQEFVFAAPVIVLAVFQSFLFANYREAWQADELWSASILVFPFWSCWTSYAAATTGFSVVKRKAVFWFLALPSFFYVVTLGVVGTLYAMFGQHAV